MTLREQLRTLWCDFWIRWNLGGLHDQPQPQEIHPYLKEPDTCGITVCQKGEDTEDKPKIEETFAITKYTSPEFSKSLERAYEISDQYTRQHNSNWESLETIPGPRVWIYNVSRVTHMKDHPSIRQDHYLRQ